MARCFGENPNGTCKVLYGDCDKDKCSFYKSVEQAKSDRAEAENRCRKLGIPSNNDYVVWKKAKDMALHSKYDVQLP